MLKYIVLKIGKFIVDFSTGLDFFLIFLTAILGTFFIFVSNIELSQKWIYVSILFLILFLLIIFAVITKYLIYILIDIKENLNKLTNTEQNKNLDNKITKFLTMFVSLILTLILSGLCISTILYFNRPFLDQKNNFSTLEVYNTLKNTSKYTDKIQRKQMGFIYNIEGEKIIVKDVLPNSPAVLAGLKTGDKISKIDNKIPKNYQIDTVNKMLKGKSHTITFERNNVPETVKITRALIDVPNIPPSLSPALYFNSLKFKNEYALGYFKIPHENGQYMKRGVICNCQSDYKSITTFWNGTYLENKLIREDNYLKTDNLVEENIYPNTYGDTMWQSVCYFHKNQPKK